MKKLILSTIVFCFLSVSCAFAQSVTIVPGASPTPGIKLSNIVANRRIVLWENGNNDHQFFGLGINNNTLRYQVDQVISSHVFYAGTSTTTSNELMRIAGTGQVGIGTSSFGLGEKFAVKGSTLQLGIFPGYLDGTPDPNWTTIDMNATQGLRVWDNFSVSGTVGIGTTNPGAKLEVAGDIKITGGTPGVGKILTSDANGLASWQTAVTHSIGESYGGGIVFYVYDNGQHGLIAAPTDQSTGIQWYNGTDVFVNATRTGILAGILGTERIIIAQGVGNYAAQVCAAYNGGGFGNWYLPHTRELELLYAQKAIVGGFSDTGYWNCGEISATHASFIDFTNGGGGGGLKSTLRRVRAIRAF